MTTEITKQNTSNEVAVVQNEIQNFAALVDLSTSLKDMKPQITLTAEYIELEKPSESFRGIYIGTQTMNITD